MIRNIARTGIAIVLGAACLFGVVGALGCASSDAQPSESADSAPQPGGEISVYSREDGSGTRGAFVELFDLEEKDASGNKIDTTTDSAAITNSTSVMMTSVANDPKGIGYISLGSLNDTVKAVAIDEVEATTKNVKSGDYRISRPFNVVTSEDLSAPAQDFIDFIMSVDGQTIVEDNGYIAVANDAAPYEASGASGKVVVAGSSSVTPVMEKLAEAYQAVNPDVVVEVQQSDSTTGVNMTVEKTCDIGMTSRDLKDSETAAGAKSTAIAQDGIAVIVAPESAINSLTSDQVKDIFSGNITDWADIAG